MATLPFELNSYLNSYLELNKTLAKTLVIKSAASNDILNDFIRLKYGNTAVDDNDPQSWKYYRNIAGLYHPLDTPMTVISLDTLEQIVFSKENLAVHTATQEAYAFGSRFYYSLVNQYPDQEQLILGILYPVDIDQAIAAEEGSILGYPPGLVEPQEITLIADLESWIKRWLVRWNVQAYGLSDSLYNTAYHLQLYLALLPAIINLRARRCKTYEVHSFHIRQYLASHGGLDRYLPYMTLKQALFFYRNIDYLFNNSGKVEQFKLLIDRLLTDRRIPISEYTVRQLNRFDDLYYPEIIARKKAINSQYNIPEKDYISIEALYNKEEKLVYGNTVYYENEASNDTLKFKNSISSVIQTKDLESAMVDYTDAVPDTLESILLRQWAYMAHYGLYNVVINFKDPVTSEVRSLYAEDALIYMYYIQLKCLGMNINELPMFLNFKVRRHPKPELSDLLSVVDTSFTDLPDIAQAILDAQPKITACYSTKNFNKLCQTLYDQSYKHWILVSQTEDYYKRALVSNMILRLYQDEALVLHTQNMPMDAWLNKLNLPEYNYTYEQANELIQEIFIKATGLSVDETKVLKNIQNAMISLLLELSSYSIQCIREINTSDILPLNWSAIRVGNIQNQAKDQEELNNGIFVLEHSCQMQDSLDCPTDLIAITEVDLNTDQSYNLDIGNKIDLITKENCTIELPIQSFQLAVDFDGYLNYASLTEEQKIAVSSLYNS